MILEAPYEGPQTALLLPNPDLGNTEGSDLSIDFKLAMDGTRYTYVRSSSQLRLTFTWDSLGRGKLVEVQEFIRAYAGKNIKLTDFRNRIWKVIFTENTTDFNVSRRASPLIESGSLTLEFLGVQVS